MGTVSCTFCLHRRKKITVFAQEEQKNTQDVLDGDREEGSQAGEEQSVLEIKKQLEAKQRARSIRTADSTDAVSSFLTRRFG